MDALIPEERAELGKKAAAARWGRRTLRASRKAGQAGGISASNPRRSGIAPVVGSAQRCTIVQSMGAGAYRGGAIHRGSTKRGGARGGARASGAEEAARTTAERQMRFKWTE